MSKSKFVIDRLAKLFEQGLISYKDLSNEIINILKSKKDEINFSKDAIAAIDHSNGEYFLISDKSEKELTDAHGGQSWLVPGSIMLSAFGLWMILVSLGIF